MADVWQGHLPSGEVVSITRSNGTQSYARTMQYDSQGRMVGNIEPSLSYGSKYWRYVFNDAGDLVGTSDARGCGSNYKYDTAGRLIEEDYAPCEPHHAAYSTAPEVVYQFDDAASLPPSCLGAQQNTLGKLVSVTDRGGKAITRYNARGQTIQVAKMVNAPDGTPTSQWFCKDATYDAADRPKTETTGTGPESWVQTNYTRRGAVGSVTSAYGLLVAAVKRDADGLVTEIRYGDGASTTTGFNYDDLRRLRNLTTYRAKPSSWPTTPSPDQLASEQLLLQDEQYTYDRVGNPTEIKDWRIASEWPSGSKPVTKKMQYDDLYRLSKMEYQYPGGSDAWVDPFQAEANGKPGPKPMPRTSFAGGNRPQWQTWSYDWLGNQNYSDDDAHAFYDRSLGEIEGNYQIVHAENIGKPGGKNGRLDATWDAAGYLLSLDMQRDGACIPSGSCGYTSFEYLWDEVGRLVRAKRWDNWTLGADLTYQYDASDSRVLKTAHEGTAASHSVYIFGSLELRRATWTGTEYEHTDATEVPYLFAHGVRLARVVHTMAPDFTSPSTRVYLSISTQTDGNRIKYIEGMALLT